MAIKEALKPAGLAALGGYSWEPYKTYLVKPGRAMKRFILLLSLAFMLSACGGGKNTDKLSKRIEELEKKLAEATDLQIALKLQNELRLKQADDLEAKRKELSKLYNRLEKTTAKAPCGAMLKAIYVKNTEIEALAKKYLEPLAGFPPISQQTGYFAGQAAIGD